MKIIWVNTWFDPGKEADAATALADQGADILTQHTDSAGRMQIAERARHPGFGQDSDMIKFGPKAQLTAIINNWAPYYIDRIKLALDGKWATGDVWGGLKPKHRADGALHQHARRREEAGDGHRGRDHGRQAASVQVPGASSRTARRSSARAARNLDDGQILSMNFYIKGIDEKLPGK